MTTPNRLITLASILVAAPAVLAQAPRPDPVQEPEETTSPEVTPEPTEESRDLKRILHLRDGSVIRGRARMVDERWEFRSRNDWRPLPHEAVVRVVDERRALSQARDLEQALDSDDPVRRVALADWMVDQGLVEEALGQLDRVLRAEPGQPDAIRMLSEPPVPLQVFRNRTDADALTREAAGATPAVRELALGRLAELEDEAVLFERLRETLHSHSPRLRTFAAQGLGRRYPGEEVKGLLMRSVLDGSEDVRREAAVAVGEANEPAFILPVLRAVGSKHSSVRENAIQALGNMGYPAAVSPLMTHMSALVSAPQSGGSYRAPRSNIFVGRQIAYIQDFDVEVAQFSAVADPQVNVLTEGSVLDVRVHGISVQSIAVESRKLRTAMAQLTGANPGNTSRSWLEWWKENQNDWVTAPPTETVPRD